MINIFEIPRVYNHLVEIISSADYLERFGFIWNYMLVLVGSFVHIYLTTHSAPV